MGISVALSPAAVGPKATAFGVSAKVVRLKQSPVKLGRASTTGGASMGTICLLGTDTKTGVGATLLIFGCAVVAVSLHFLLTTAFV